MPMNDEKKNYRISRLVTLYTVVPLSAWNNNCHLVTDSQMVREVAGSTGFENLGYPVEADGLL